MDAYYVTDLLVCQRVVIDHNPFRRIISSPLYLRSYIYHL